MMKVVMCLRPNELWRSPDLWPLHQPINRQLRSQEDLTGAAGATCPRQCRMFRIQTSSFIDTSAGHTLNVFLWRQGVCSVLRHKLLTDLYKISHCGRRKNWSGEYTLSSRIQYTYVLRTMTVKINVVWGVTSCSLVDKLQ